MNLVFSQAKNNEKTFSVDGIYYHSRYNPSAEVEKWINQIECNFIPKVIVILGCGLPFCVRFLKEKFSTSKILLIQYHETILEEAKKEINSISNNSVLQISTTNYNSPEKLSEFLFENFSEEISNQILFLSWKPAEKIFQNEFNLAINSVQLYLEKSKDIIATRRFFSKKWISNILRFFNFAKNFYQIEKGNKDVLIVVSGPSLNNSITKIIENRKNIFIICLSSATKVLIHNKIIPDVILTTDGGYWAKKHLQFLEKSKLEIPIICSVEASLSFNLLKNSPIIPLEYPDFTNTYFFNKSKLFSIKTNRNGTVSGNALEIAKQLTTANIYFVGLDLSTTNTYQHTQPNILEINDSLKDFKIENKETRISNRNINSSALKTYRNWFENLPKEYTKNVKRIFAQNDLQENLGNIESTTWKNISFSKFDKEQKITKQIISNNIDIKFLLKKIIDDFENLDSLEKIYEKNLNWINNLSLGNILNYNKFKNILFLENSIIETKNFFYEQLKKLEKIK